ncbi:MAG TPA: vWA domain-containing protein [Polyangia bacterium]
MVEETRYNGFVARDIQPILLACLVAGGMACAEVDDPVGIGTRQDASPDATYDSGLVNPFGCLATSESRDFRQADVLVLLDRSGSMDTAYGSGTRYQAVATMLSDLVATYAAHVRFGYQEMPGRQSCDARLVSGCCASPPLVRIADSNAQEVIAAIAAAEPMDGNTPTAASLQAALAYYQNLNDGIDNRFVLLATDGAPNCTLAGALSSGDASDATSPACADALSQVSAMVALGVRVMVLNLGTGLGEDANGGAACLDALAHAGGDAASPGSPGYYSAHDPQQLRLAIEQVFGGVQQPSCSLRLGKSVRDTAKVAVYLDGQPIPRNAPSGWYLDSSLNPPNVVITGTWCEQIQDFQVTKVEAQYDCMPCVEGVGCNP